MKDKKNIIFEDFNGTLLEVYVPERDENGIPILPRDFDDDDSDWDWLSSTKSFNDKVNFYLQLCYKNKALLNRLKIR